MEVRTIYQHKAKHSSTSLLDSNNKEFRVVTFIGGDKDMLDIIKQLIINKYQS